MLNNKEATQDEVDAATNAINKILQDLLMGDVNFDEDNIVMSFGAISDIHINNVVGGYNCNKYDKALQLLKKYAGGKLDAVTIAQPETKEIRDTLASLRLDSVISSGFRIGRSLAAQYVNAGKAAIDGLPCEKPDKTVSEGSKISVRGLGKIKLVQVNGRTKKDRISVVIHRYV